MEITPYNLWAQKPFRFECDVAVSIGNDDGR